MFCTYTRPIYQVSVHRTIGPLVVLLISFFDEIHASKHRRCDSARCGVTTFRVTVYCYLWCYWLIMTVQLIERGQVVIPTRPVIKCSRPFYLILLKEANLF